MHVMPRKYLKIPQHQILNAFECYGVMGNCPGNLSKCILAGVISLSARNPALKTFISQASEQASAVGSDTPGSLFSKLTAAPRFRHVYAHPATLQTAAQSV